MTDKQLVERVELRAGAVNLPDQFREVARLANAAGRQGLEVQDVAIGIDPELAKGGDFRCYATIRYLRCCEPS